MKMLKQSFGIIYPVRSFRCGCCVRYSKNIFSLFQILAQDFHIPECCSSITNSEAHDLPHCRNEGYTMGNYAFPFSTLFTFLNAQMLLHKCAHGVLFYFGLTFVLHFHTHTHSLRGVLCLPVRNWHFPFLCTNSVIAEFSSNPFTVVCVCAACWVGVGSLVGYR